MQQTKPLQKVKDIVNYMFYARDSIWLVVVRQWVAHWAKCHVRLCKSQSTEMRGTIRQRWCLVCAAGRGGGDEPVDDPGVGGSAEEDAAAGGGGTTALPAGRQPGRHLCRTPAAGHQAHLRRQGRRHRRGTQAQPRRSRAPRASPVRVLAHLYAFRRSCGARKHPKSECETRPEMLLQLILFKFRCDDPTV